MRYYDDRWAGRHGIGRFAQEVCSRLPKRVERCSLGGSPTSSIDIANLNRMKLNSDDVLYSPGFNVGVARVRQLLTIHDLIHIFDVQRFGSRRRVYYDLLVKPVIRRSGLVLTVSETSRRSIAKWINDDSTEIVNVGNGCSEAFRQVFPRHIHEQPHFLYVGNMKPHKNVSVLLEALTLRPEYRLLIVTSEYSLIRNKVVELDVQEQIDVLSNLTDSQLSQLYRDSHGLLFPSRLEGFGLPALEAVSCGTRVAYWSSCASVREIVGNRGVSVDSCFAAEEWADAMDILANSSNIPLHGAEWWSKYDWEDVARATSDAIDRLH